MIDLKYYLKTSLSNDDFVLFDKYFSKYNFKTVHSASMYFKNLKETDISWLSSSSIKDKILSTSSAVGDRLHEQTPNLSELLKTEIMQRVNIDTLLSDLQPKIRHNNTTLMCPCCDKKEAFIGGAGKGSTIICNRQNECGETTTILSHIMDREGLNFFKGIEFIADNAGIELSALVATKEIQKGSGEEIDYNKERVEVNVEPIIHQYKPEPIEFDTLDTTKQYEEISVTKYIPQFKDMNDTQKYQIVLAYIRDYSMANRDDEKVEEFFKGRGLALPNFSSDVGFISASNIPKLVKNLKDTFGEKDLCDLTILSEKGYWKHGAVNKETDKFKYCDALLFSMHKPYSDIPTNLEFRFIGEGAVGVKNKTSAIENSSLIAPNFYGDKYKVDALGSKNTWWFCEGAIDAKTISSVGYNASSLIGVHKHFANCLGYFKDKVAIIAFDQDNAGMTNVQKFAEKLYMAGAKQIIVATWDMDLGKDSNDLLMSNNLDKIKFSSLLREEVEVDGYIKPIFSYSINVADIDKASLENRLKRIKELEVEYTDTKVSVASSENTKSESNESSTNTEVTKSSKSRVVIKDKEEGSLGLERFMHNV
jgi:Toprim-like